MGMSIKEGVRFLKGDFFKIHFSMSASIFPFSVAIFVFYHFA